MTNIIEKNSTFAAVFNFRFSFSMYNYKLLAFDLDGTLTNDDKVITPLTMEALRTVQHHQAQPYS